MRVDASPIGIAATQGGLEVNQVSMFSSGIADVRDPDGS